MRLEGFCDSCPFHLVEVFRWPVEVATLPDWDASASGAAAFRISYSTTFLDGPFFSLFSFIHSGIHSGPSSTNSATSLRALRLRALAAKVASKNQKLKKFEEDV
jgi:hypothetical protein